MTGWPTTRPLALVIRGHPPPPVDSLSVISFYHLSLSPSLESILSFSWTYHIQLLKDFPLDCYIFPIFVYYGSMHCCRNFSVLSLSSVITAHLMTYTSSKQDPLMIPFKFGKRKMSLKARSGELEGYSSTVLFLLDTNWRMLRASWVSESSSWTSRNFSSQNFRFGFFV